jgi:glycolate oxidase FAD binding subunit
MSMTAVFPSPTCRECDRVIRAVPSNESDIADTVREAAAKNAPVEIVAGGTKRDFGRASLAHSILDVSALTGIVSYEPEELVLRARAGTRIADIVVALAEKNQMLGFEPADWGPLFGMDAGRATLGGIVSANACGARRVKAGAVRDHIIGCRFVNGRGEIVKAGGPVIKNVTGFDIPKLMCGAFGTLGVLTEVTLRVSPLSERIAALPVRCPAQDGLRVLREAAKLPLDVSGLAYVPWCEGGTAFIRVEGTYDAVEQKLAELRNRLGGNGAHALEGEVARMAFREIGDGTPFVKAGTDIWRLCVPEGSAYDALVATGAQETNLWYADWAGGLLWLGLPADEAPRLRAITARFGGHATLMRASREARARTAIFEPETPGRAALTRSVKAAFDPRDILNPGRMFEDI